MFHPRAHHLQQAWSQLEQPTTRPISHGNPRPPAQPLPPLELFDNRLTIAPSSAQLLDVWLRACTGQGIPKSKPVHQVTIEAVLSDEQLRRGASLPLRVPVFQQCDTCSGSGRAGFFDCDRCDGEGIAMQVRQIDVLIPAGTAEGAVLPVSLGHMGIRNIRLNVRIRRTDA